MTTTSAEPGGRVRREKSAFKAPGRRRSASSCSQQTYQPAARILLFIYSALSFLGPAALTPGLPPPKRDGSISARLDSP